MMRERRRVLGGLRNCEKDPKAKNLVCVYSARSERAKTLLALAAMVDAGIWDSGEERYRPGDRRLYSASWRPSPHASCFLLYISNRCMASRPLNLHVSALNDAEYDLYTTSLADITLSDNESTHDDAYFETLSVSVREARAWLRGRYSHISAATLDSVNRDFFSCFKTNNLYQILRFFSPTDMLSGGQFFAAIRLVVHAESGREVDRTLAFVQGMFLLI